MDLNDLPEEQKEVIRRTMAENPELVERFGNPFDASDPRMWKPTAREDADISLDDRVHYMALDIEMLQDAVARLIVKNSELETLLRIQSLKQLAKDDPEAAAKELLKLLDGAIPPAAYGPEGDDGPAYAGSTGHGITPDSVVETVNGPIRAEQIPGYKNDPEWRPSPDWAEANCTCPAHVAMREQAGSPFSDGDEFPTGFYL